MKRIINFYGFLKLSKNCRISKNINVHPMVNLPGTNVRTDVWGACRDCEVDMGSCSSSVADATRVRRRRQLLGRTRRLGRRRRPRERSHLARDDAPCHRPPDADEEDAPGEHCECCDASYADREGGSCGCCDVNYGGRDGNCGYFDADCDWLGTDRRARTNPCTADSGSELSGCRGWTCDYGASAVAAIPKAAASCAEVASEPVASPGPLSRTRHCEIFDDASLTGTRSKNIILNCLSAHFCSRCK